MMFLCYTARVIKFILLVVGVITLLWLFAFVKIMLIFGIIAVGAFLVYLYFASDKKDGNNIIKKK